MQSCTTSYLEVQSTPHEPTLLGGRVAGDELLLVVGLPHGFPAVLGPQRCHTLHGHALVAVT